ncbi:hypothetical protein SAMN02910456_01422 [Ruminococcaceae bacterium YRB3002]|nr:hypothetical protein SAMN02910456_01422 [Ruminococcaceae bacterium YRB3002]
MKTRDNDEVLESYFQAELNKIPSFFRLNKLSMGIAASIGVLVVIFLQCAVFFIKARGENNIFDGITNLMTFAIVFCCAIIPVLITVLWFITCYCLEKKAYRRASEFARKHSQWDEQRVIKEHKEFLKEYKEPEEQEPEPQYCPKCGLLLMRGETRCGSCGAEVTGEEE